MDVRTRFVKFVLESEGARLVQRQSDALAVSGLKSRTGRLMDGRSVSVAGGSNMDGKMTFVHPDYERFLDMKQLRRGSETVRSNRRIHNRYTFGAYNSIARRLLCEFTDATADLMKSLMPLDKTE